mmetsp:Transcript_1757/g.5775  ORF Transcript_1757/g.5775 Transcript_1757/m.5775 type:complete len:204 (+) Transcript_1757:440-1051(+)
MQRARSEAKAEQRVAVERRLGDQAENAEHGEAAVVELRELVPLPAEVVDIHVLRGAEEVTRHVVGALLQDEREALHGRDEGQDLHPGDAGDSRRIGERGRARGDTEEVKERVKARGARGGEEAERGEHGHAAMLELRLAHELRALRVLAEAERIEETQRGAVTHHTGDAGAHGAGPRRHGARHRARGREGRSGEDEGEHRVRN